MISDFLSQQLDKQPRSVPDSVMKEFLKLRDQMLKLCKTRYVLQESKVHESTDPWVVENRDRFINLLNDISMANHRLILKYMARSLNFKKGRQLVGDDTFEELYLILRQTILNYNPRRGELSTLFWTKAKRIYALKRKPPLVFLPPEALPGLELTFDDLERDTSMRDMEALFCKYLSPTEAEICYRHFIKGESQVAISRAVKIARVDRILSRAVKKLREIEDVRNFLK